MRFCGVLLVFLLLAGTVRAAPTREERAYATAVAAFHDRSWNVAELDFAEFVQKYPESPLVPQAGIFQAQAAIKQGKFGAAQSLLTALRPKAGKLADDCTYWLGEAQFGSGDLRTAAATLASLPKASPLALQGAVTAGVAMDRLNEWPQLTNFFKMDQDLFVNAEQTDPDNEMVLRGRLLLAKANFAQKEYALADSLLARIRPAVLSPDLEWQRLYLLCEVKLAQGDLQSVLPVATQLVALARQLPGENGPVSLPASIALRAQVLERLPDHVDAAMAAYRENLTLTPAAPEERQRQAILKIAELAIKQQNFTNAEAMLNNFATQFTNAPALDIAWLTLGELYLHDYVSQPSTTNLVAAARQRFDQLLTTYTNSSFTGQAYLDRGWCYWLETNYVAGLADFQSAVAILPPSVDLAVARFKLADTLFARADYADALKNYQVVLWQFTNNFPQVLAALGDRALYQSLRAQLRLEDLAGAAVSMARLAAAYPLSELSESSTLLLGEGYTDLREPANALALFNKFLVMEPQSPLRPSVELAIARAYEQEQTNWPAALAQYDRWLKAYPTNAQLPQVLYARAWATSQSGDQTNALALFTNFVAQFPTNDLAPLAQWWVADHYLSLGAASANVAEINYKSIFQNTNWLNSSLYYPAQLMAGRAAVARTDYDGAIRKYFAILEDDTNCSPELRIQATFMHGSALMKMESPDTNNPTTNFSYAVTVFNRICVSFPTNEIGARAWGMIGNCYLQLSRYDAATNAFGQALAYAGTNLAVQSEAQIGLGIVLEKKAALVSGANQTNLLTQAEANYYDVLQAAVHGGGQSDPGLYWAKVAGLKAADLAVALGYWENATNFYGQLLQVAPELQASLARRIAAANQHLTAPKK